MDPPSSDQCEPTSASSDSQDPTVTLLVGPSHGELELPLSNFRRSTADLTALLDDETMTVGLYNDHPPTVQKYTVFLITRQVFHDSYADIARLYVFADRYSDLHLKDLLVDKLIQAVKLRKTNAQGIDFMADAQVVNIVYGGTGKHCVGRRLMVDLFVAYGKMDWLDAGNYHSDFTLDLAWTLMGCRNQHSRRDLSPEAYFESTW